MIGGQYPPDAPNWPVAPEGTEPRARRGCLRAVAVTVLVIVSAIVAGVALAVVFSEHVLDRNQPVGQPPAVVGPTASVGVPPNALPIAAPAQRRVANSVVRVTGIACQEIQQGSGFVVRPGFVVTDAHVVAGERATSVIDHRGRRVAATVVRFDPVLDLALLRLGGRDATALPALTLAAPHAPAALAVFGHPGGGSLRIAPAGLSASGLVDAVGRDIYGRDAPGTRRLARLAARLAPGDSGAPVVDRDTEVVAVAFAIDPKGAPVAYALTAPQVKGFLSGTVPATPVSTGRCISL